MAGTLILSGIDFFRVLGILLAVIGIVLLFVRYKYGIPFLFDKNQHGAQNGSVCILAGVFLAASGIQAGIIGIVISLVALAVVYYVFWHRTGYGL